MPFNPTDFRTLDVREISPFGGVLSDAIAKRLAMANAETKEAELPYAGPSKLAHALSAATYAQFMPAQFGLKAAANPAIRSSMSEGGRQASSDLASNVVTGNNNPLVQNLMETYRKQQEKANQPSFWENLLNTITGNKPAPQQQIMQTGTPNIPTAIPNASPSGTVTTSNQTSPQQGGAQKGVYDKYGNLLPTIKKEQEYHEEIEKGKEVGKEKGKQQSEYGEQIVAPIAQLKSLKDITNILKDPIFTKVADTPFFNSTAQYIYGQAGYEKEKKALGQLDAATNAFVSDTFSLFKGKGVTDKDLEWIQNYKTSDKDTIDMKKGKLISLITTANSKLQQTELAHRYMKENHMDKADAELKASKQIDMDKIRKDAYDMVYPSPQKIIQDQLTTENIIHTAKKRKMTVPQVFEELEKRGIKIPDRIPA